MAGTTGLQKVLGAIDDVLAHPTAASKLAKAEGVVAHSAVPVGAAVALAEEAAAVAATRPVTRLFPLIVERVRGVLRAEGSPARLLPSPRRTRALCRVAVEVLGERRIAALSEAELAALAATLRRELVLRSAAVIKARSLGRTRVRAMTKATGTSVRATAVDLPQGVWVFVHTNGPDPVVLVEGFAPRAAAKALPTPPPFPGPGTPRWLPEGVTAPVSVRPPLPATVLTEAETQAAAAGARLLDGLPTAVVEQMLRAERHRLGRAWQPLTARLVDWVGEVPTRVRRTLGTGIERVSYERARGPGGSYDVKVVLEGHTGPTTGRFPDVDVLPEPKDAFGPGSLMQRLHAWGNILGDSTPAGMGYGTRELNLAMLRTIEQFLTPGTRGRVRLSVTAYLQHRPTLAGVQPFVRTVIYRWVDGDVARAFAVGVDDAGKVFTRPVVP